MHFIYQKMQKYAFKFFYDKHKNIVKKKFLLIEIHQWLDFFLNPTSGVSRGDFNPPPEKF
jgi:hypothetical protein